MAASNTYLFLTDVLPRAIKKYGGISADALRKAALDTDVPEGGTMLGFGVKFAGRGAADGRPERPRLPGGRAVRRRQGLCGLAEAQQQREPVLKLPASSPYATELTAASVLEVAGLVKRFGGFTAVNNVSFKVDQGEILGLIGPNGSGKSTIFNMLSGTLAPTAGSIRFQGREIAGMPPHRIIHQGIGRTFQIPRPFRRLSIFENVALAGFYGQRRHHARRAHSRRPNRRWPWSACRPTARRRSTASAPPG